MFSAEKGDDFAPMREEEQIKSERMEKAFAFLL